MANLRQERANSDIIKALSIIVREKINDPRLNNYFITFTYVNTSADFRHCKVGFSVLNGDKKSALQLLVKMEGFIKKELLKMVKLPFAPALEFIIDSGEDNSERINEILKNLNIPKEEISEEEEDF